jgi:hypothetical protein
MTPTDRHMAMLLLKTLRQHEFDTDEERLQRIVDWWHSDGNWHMKPIDLAEYWIERARTDHNMRRLLEPRK